MAKTRELPLSNYPTGSQTFVRQTPNGLRGFLIEIARCTTAEPTIWPNESTELALTVVPSYDGGLTFDPVAKASYRTSGGIKVSSKTGLEAPSFVFDANFNPPANAVKITVEVINGPLRTSADVTIL